MQTITWENYRAALPESLHEKFIALANANARRHMSRSIIYADKVLRYANPDED